MATTPNKHRNEVVITLDGTDYTVRPTFDLIAKIEGAFGGCLTLAQEIAQNQWSVTKVAGVIAIAVKSSGCRMKEQEIMELVFEEGPTSFLPVILDLCTGALQGSLRHRLSDGDDDPAAGEGEAQTA